MANYWARFLDTIASIITRMANRASAIIISKRHILLINRIRTKGEFYVFPGGNIEEGESPEEACIREVLEETGLKTAWLQAAFDFSVDNRMAHYYFVEVFPGTMTLGGPESQKRSEQNRYLLEWVPLSKISQLNLRPGMVRDAIVRVTADNQPVLEARDMLRYQAQLQKILSETDHNPSPDMDHSL
jgi:8-oxo-dGTP diphosphatase